MHSCFRFKICKLQQILSMATSSIFSLANRVKSAILTRICQPIIHHHVQNNQFHKQHYCTEKPQRRPSLASTIFPLGHPSIDLKPILDTWVQDGNFARDVDIQYLVRDLRRRKRYKQALQASEWLKEKSDLSFTHSDQAVHLNLIGQVRGLEHAETYFANLSEKDLTEKTYGALLNCYVQNHLVEKSLAHFQKMKELGFASSALSYNDIMCLYTYTEQYEKIPTVLTEMKNNRVLPDNYSYRICINSYGARLDIDGMENVLTEMKHQPQIVVDWNTYSVVANIYIKAGLIDKACSALKRAEERLDRNNGVCYNHLISLYAKLGNKSDMQRIWALQKENLKRFINRDYSTMLGALVKLEEIEEAEKLLNEWENSNNSFDFRVPNILLAGYREKGLLDRADALVDKYLKNGKKPPSSSWGIVAVGFAEKRDVKKAYELMVNALTVYVHNCGWRINLDVTKSVLQYLGDECKVEVVETFVNLLKNAMPTNRDMYHALIKAYIREGREIDEVVMRMKADGMEEDEEIQETLNTKLKMATST